MKPPPEGVEKPKSALTKQKRECTREAAIEAYVLEAKKQKAAGNTSGATDLLTTLCKEMKLQQSCSELEELKGP